MDPNHYMSSALNSAVSNSYQSARAAASPYSLSSGSSYFQHYHHHRYPMRLHHSYDYSKDPGWGHYNSATVDQHPYQSYYQHTQPQPPTTSCTTKASGPSTSSTATSPQHRSSKRISPAKSPRRSPISTSNQSNTARSPSGLAVITPVAIRPSTSGAAATSGSQLKATNLSSDFEEVENMSWKSSPIQEVPEFYEYPFFTPPYSATPTKASTFNFDSFDLKEQRLVPNLDSSDMRWSAESCARSPWLPPDEITGPLRILSHL